MTTRSQLSRAESALRKHALAYPKTYEEFPWEHRAIKIKGKVFLFLYREDTFLSLSLKLPLSSQTALTLPFASPTGYGLSKTGWVTARFEAGDAVPVDMLCEWIDESFRAVAPKKLVARLESAEGGRLPEADAAAQPPKRRKRSPRS